MEVRLSARRGEGTRWGDPIREERQAESRVLADRQREWAVQPEAERGNSVFARMHLTGADVFWLAVALRCLGGRACKPVPSGHHALPEAPRAFLIQAHVALLANNP